MAKTERELKHEIEEVTGASRAVEGGVDWNAARVIWERAQGQLRKYVNGQLYGWYDERGLWWYATGTAVRASRC